jgi:hypothetical protein
MLIPVHERSETFIRQNTNGHRRYNQSIENQYVSVKNMPEMTIALAVFSQVAEFSEFQPGPGALKLAAKREGLPAQGGRMVKLK